jgi:glycosyltransferase involved in cell wall biosynthesis
MPKVSVVMATYNRAHFLGESIQGILDQSFKDFEIIVVDDGSTDNTEEVVSHFPVIYLRQENQGPVVAQNKAIELSQAEYITFQGSDDIFLQDAISKNLDMLDHHPEVAFSYGQVYLIDEAGQIVGLRKPNREKISYVREGVEEIRRLVLWGNRIPACTVMARRSCIDEVGFFNPTFRSGSEDFDLWVRLAKRYSVAYIAEPLAKYRIHLGSGSAGRDIKEIERSNISILTSIFSDPELGPAFSTYRESAYAHLYLRMAFHAYARQDMRTARKNIFRALKTHPSELPKRLGASSVSLLVKTMMPLALIGWARNIRKRIEERTLPLIPTK